MRKALAIAAVAGLTTAASAQYTINISADATTANYGDTITWTVSATGSFAAGEYVYAYDMSFTANDDTLGTASTFADNLQAVAVPTAGVASGASITGASGGQSSLLSGNSQVAGPVVLGTFTVVAGNADGSLTYSLSDGGILGGTTVFRTKIGSDFTEGFNGMPGVNADTVRITDVPSPASAALLGLGGLVATRRRR